MPTRPRPKLNLRILLLAFALIAAFSTLANTFWVMLTTQRAELVENALQTNKAYAARIADSLNGVLSSDLDRLSYAATSIGENYLDQAMLEKEANRLLGQDHSFNSVIISDSEGKVIASAPGSMRLDGQLLQNRSPLSKRKPMISDAFLSLADHLVVFVSHPVFNSNKQYLGLVGGSIRLEQKNTIQALMDLNVREDGAYIFLVDSHRRILYHPDPKKIGEVLGTNRLVDAALEHTNGSMQAINESGNEVLAGYARIPSSHWGVVSEQPFATIQASLESTAKKVAKGVAPLGLFGLLIVWWIGRKISAPLSRLAETAKRLDAPECYERITAIPADYIESWQIRRALLLATNLLQEKIGRLNIQAQSDPLTGLTNRRGMDEAIGLWQEALKSFAVISVDIDHFKAVNDTYGHGVGDETLREVARLMKQASRPGDLVCRVGGEEFVLLLPNSTTSIATDVAERLRIIVASAQFETVGHITVSLGVALWKMGEPVTAAFEKADQFLYRAKSLGRNRVVSENLNFQIAG